ncbi:MAG TPA: Uma2 family endonuclease [Polyangiaceae bacterium]|jgi:Uma2 family endonuclease
MAIGTAQGFPRFVDVDRDDRVVLHGLEWQQFEMTLAVRGDRAGARLAYLEGDLEIMSPSRSHDFIKTTIGRLLEAYAEEKGVYFNGYGSLTMKEPALERGAEPDECYVIGQPKERPDLVIEVIWTSGGIDKRRLYAGLGISELWEWRDGRIELFILRGSSYVPATRSELLPNLDLALLARLVQTDDQTQAVREFRTSLRS